MVGATEYRKYFWKPVKIHSIWKFCWSRAIPFFNSDTVECEEIYLFYFFRIYVQENMIFLSTCQKFHKRPLNFTDKHVPDILPLRKQHSQRVLHMIMEGLHSQSSFIWIGNVICIQIKGLIFEYQKGCIRECEKFKYLGMKIDKGDRQENGIKNRINKGRAITPMLNRVLWNSH